MNEPPELPSKSSQEDHSSEAEKVNILYDNRTRVQAVLIVFGLFILLGLFSLYSGYLEIKLISEVNEGVQITDDMADNNDTRQAGIQLSLFILRIISIPVFLMWFYHAYGNLHLLGRTKLKFSHSASLYNWFIPVINWFQPYFMMKELWTNIQEEIKINDPTFVSEKGNSKIGLWWLLFLCANLIGELILRILADADTLSSILLTSKIIFVIDTIRIIDAGLVMIIVYNIFQKEKLLLAYNS